MKWIEDATAELVTGINKFFQKVTQPNAQKPPPGTLTNYIKETISKYAPTAVPDAKKPAKEPANEALTPTNIYVTPLAGSVPLKSRILEAVLVKPLRVGQLAEKFGVKKEQITAAIAEKDSGLFIQAPGWVKKAA